ncbi:hypothetical protein HDU96_005841 [Phlyctochytrium bullatum]|nr:hypothetical protein HDU96_005841 [Phlyctochytrium bullatum]
MKLPALAVAFCLWLTAVVSSPLPQFNGDVASSVADERPSTIGHDLAISDGGELVDLSLDRAINSTDVVDTVNGNDTDNDNADNFVAFSRAAAGPSLTEGHKFQYAEPQLFKDRLNPPVVVSVKIGPVNLEDCSIKDSAVRLERAASRLGSAGPVEIRSHCVVSGGEGNIFYR